MAYWFVVLFNLGLAAGLFGLAKILVDLRQTLAGVVQAIYGADQATHDLLGDAPAAIRLGEVGIRATRQQLGRTAVQVQQFRSLLGGLALALNLLRRWQRLGRR